MIRAKPHNRRLIIVGGNSVIVQDIISNSSLESIYREVILICHKEYRGKKSFYTLVEHTEPISIAMVVNDFLLQQKEMESVDLIIASTPTQKHAYKDNVALEWGFAAVRLLNLVVSSKHVRRAIVLGSTLSLVPFIRSGTYKSIKKIEFFTYQNLKCYKSSKIGYILLPPIGENVEGIGRIFSQSRRDWAQKILLELDTSNRLILPKGLVGLVSRILLFFGIYKHELFVS